MEILLSLAYFFIVRTVFFDRRWLPWNLFTGMLVFGLYGAAALGEMILLGQYTPYSDTVFVQRPVVQIASNLGGQVEEVYVQPHQPIQQGDALYKMVDTAIVDQLNQAKAELGKAAKLLSDARRLVARKVMAAEELTLRQFAYDAAEAAVDRYQYDLEQTTTYAPADGYVINLQLRAGQFVRLKQPVMSFVSTEEAWLVMKLRQEGSQWVRPGQEVQFALTMYPGAVFNSTVEALIEGVGEAQMSPSGQLPSTRALEPIDHFAVKIVLPRDASAKTMVFGASGLAAINTGKGADVFWLLRRLEIQSESYLNYLYNPFRG